MTDVSDTIHIAAVRGDLEAVRCFVEVEKMDVNCSDQWGTTPLIHASIGSLDPAMQPLVDASVLSYLISKNADVNVPWTIGDYRHTCLMLVSGSGHLDAVKVLLEEGNANVNARLNDLESFTALHFAMQSLEGANVIPTLLKHGAEIRCKCMPCAYNAEAFEVVLNHCRGIMTSEEIADMYLLSEDDGENIALHLSETVKFSRLLIEQPRRREDEQLLAVCRSQLLHVNKLGLRPWHKAKRSSWRPGSPAVYGEIAEYLESFESLALSIPGDDNVTACALTGTTVQAKRNDSIAMKLNPALNDFQHSVAQEALDLVADATDSLDSIAHAILGYLSALDVMKRTD